jgi:hypothetical protein
VEAENHDIAWPMYKFSDFDWGDQAGLSWLLLLLGHLLVAG